MQVYTIHIHPTCTPIHAFTLHTLLSTAHTGTVHGAVPCCDYHAIWSDTHCGSALNVYVLVTSAYPTLSQYQVRTTKRSMSNTRNRNTVPTQKPLSCTNARNHGVKTLIRACAHVIQRSSISAAAQASLPIVHMSADMISRAEPHTRGPW